MPARFPIVLHMRRLVRPITWRHFILLLSIVSVLFFLNTAIGLAPFLPLAVDLRTAGLLLTVEGFLLGLSPQIGDRRFRALIVGLTLISILYSVTVVTFLDSYQSLLPSSTVFISGLNVALLDLFRLDLFLFAITADVYAVGAILRQK